MQGSALVEIETLSVWVWRLSSLYDMLTKIFRLIVFKVSDLAFVLNPRFLGEVTWSKIISVNY